MPERNESSPVIGKTPQNGDWREFRRLCETSCLSPFCPKTRRFVDQTMPSRRTTTQDFAVCIRNIGVGASLKVRKLYMVLDDPDAEANDIIRVIDESGEDYVYPARRFQKLALPGEVQRALRLAC